MGAKLVFWQRRKYLKNAAKKQFPVFSRYIFAGMKGDVFITRLMCKSIEAILGDAFGPIHIPTGAVQKINDLEQAGQWDETLSWRAKSPFQPGAPVKLLSGAFKGFPATVDEILSEKTIRLWVALFGRATPIEVPTCEIETV